MRFIGLHGPIFLLCYFLSLTLHITERAAEGRVKLLAWLVPLTLLWTNMHGGFFVVFLVLACYIGADLLNAAIEADSGRRAAVPARHQALADRPAPRASR